MKTERLFYEDVYCTTFEAVIREIKTEKDEVWVRLDRTAFYPEGGGQPSDMGDLRWANSPELDETTWECCVSVTDVREKDGEIWHRVDNERHPTGGVCADACAMNGYEALAVGVSVWGRIDWQRRLDLMQQHSGEHIVSGLIHNRFGYDNVGFHLSVNTMTLDLNGELTWEALMDVEEAANEAVRDNRPIGITYPTESELKELTYRSKKELSGQVRIVSIPGADDCACCGTHVTRTGEIGLIKITDMQKWKNGVRVWMCCGARAEQYCRMVQEQNRRISVALSAKPEETGAAVDRVIGELAQLKQELTGWKYRYYAQMVKAYEGKPGAVLFETDLTMEDLRHLTDKLMDVCSGECFVFSGKDGEGYRYAVGRRGGDVRGLVKEMNTALSGRGGGKNEMAQGSLQAAEAQIEAWIREQGYAN